MTRGFTLALLAATLLIGGCARADDKSHKEAAAALIKAMDVEKQMLATIEPTVDNLVKGNPAFAGKKEVLVKFFNDCMSWDGLKDEYIAIYTKNFTEDELKELEKFYKTPVGKKLAGKTAEVAKMSMELGAKKVQEKQGDLLKLLQEK